MFAGCVGDNGYERYAPIIPYENSNVYDNYAIEDVYIGEDVYTSEDDYIIEIAPWDFEGQVQTIQMNREYFLGRTIRLEGMFFTSYWEDETFFFVARTGSGCCGIHGFEVYLNDFPQFNDETWVTVTGVLEEFYVPEAFQYFLRLNVISLTER